MAPILSLLRQIAADRIAGPVKFFYGCRTGDDLFYTDVIDELGRRIDRFEFVPVLSESPDEDSWSGEKGLVHDAVGAWLAAGTPRAQQEAYMAGPQPMVDAALEMLTVGHGMEPSSIFYDSFTSTGPVSEG